MHDTDSVDNGDFCFVCERPIPRPRDEVVWPVAKGKGYGDRFICEACVMDYSSWNGPPRLESLGIRFLVFRSAKAVCKETGEDYLL